MPLKLFPPAPSKFGDGHIFWPLLYRWLHLKELVFLEHKVLRIKNSKYSIICVCGFCLFLIFAHLKLLQILWATILSAVLVFYMLCLQQCIVCSFSTTFSEQGRMQPATGSEQVLPNPNSLFHPTHHAKRCTLDLWVCKNVYQQEPFTFLYI